MFFVFFLPPKKKMSHISVDVRDPPCFNATAAVSEKSCTKSNGTGNTCSLLLKLFFVFFSTSGLWYWNCFLVSVLLMCKRFQEAAAWLFKEQRRWSNPSKRHPVDLASFLIACVHVATIPTVSTSLCEALERRPQKNNSLNNVWLLKIKLNLKQRPLDHPLLA